MRDLLLGVAVSAHQVEGDPVPSDWWQAAREGRVPDPGRALDFWERFAEDMETVRALGLDAFRFSLEWARLEPEEGRYAEAAFARYGEMLATARRLGLVTLLTLQHFTLPLWLARRGGILAPGGERAFARYAAAVARRLPRPDVLFTLNEPLVLAAKGQLFGEWPPFRRSPGAFLAAGRALARWHRAAYAAVKAVAPDWRVGLVKHFLRFLPASQAARPLVAAGDYAFHEGFLALARPYDALGVNYYTTARLSARGQLLPAAFPATELGWEVAPEGLGEALRRLARFAPELWVSENGIATEDSEERLAFIRAHLAEVLRARRQGVPVVGYLYWTLYDNYEWAEGYRAHFGLGTRQRILRPEAAWFPRLLTTLDENPADGACSKPSGSAIKRGKA